MVTANTIQNNFPFYEQLGTLCKISCQISR